MRKVLILLLLVLPAHAKVRHRHYVDRDVIHTGHFSMIAQNEEINRLRLPRIVDDNQLHQLEDSGELVRVPDSENLLVAKAVKEDRRFLRPWAKQFLSDMAQDFYYKFRTPLVANSLVRTVEQQQKLRRYNSYAAPASGTITSSHLAGITVDLAKRRYTAKERKWIVSYLKNLNYLGIIMVIYEPQCYHVAVRESYIVRDYEKGYVLADATFTDYLH